MRLKPLWDQLVVKAVTEDSRAGIALPRGVGSEQHTCAEVIAVGPGTRFADGTLLPPIVNVGDTVLYRKTAGEKMWLDRKEYTLLREGDLVGILGAMPLVAVARGRL